MLAGLTWFINHVMYHCQNRLWTHKTSKVLIRHR